MRKLPGGAPARGRWPLRKLLRRRRKSTKRRMASARSSSVDSSSVSTPARVRLSRSSASRCGRDAGKALAKAAVVCVHQQLLAGFGVAHREQAQIGQLQLQRVEQAHGHHIVPPRQLTQRLLPAGLADEVGQHEHGAALAHRVGGAAKQIGETGGTCHGFTRCWRRSASLHQLHQAEHLRPAAARWQHRVNPRRAARTVLHRTDPVAMAADQPREHRHKTHQQFALALRARAEVHRGTEVEQKPGRHFAVFGEHAHMGLLQPRGHVPVDVAHVVVVLVFAQVGQIETAAAHEGSEIALQQAIEPAHHGPLQALQHRIGALGGRCRTRWWRLGFRAFFEETEHGSTGRQAAFFSCSIGRVGGRTAAMMRAATESPSSPSDKPSYDSTMR